MVLDLPFAMDGLLLVAPPLSAVLFVLFHMGLVTGNNLRSLCHWNLLMGAIKKPPTFTFRRGRSESPKRRRLAVPLQSS